MSIAVARLWTGQRLTTAQALPAASITAPTDTTSSGFNIHTAGVILLVVGIIGFVLSLAFWTSWGGFGGWGGGGGFGGGGFGGGGGGGGFSGGGGSFGGGGASGSW